MVYSSLLPFNNSVKKIYQKQFGITVFSLIVISLFFFLGRIQITKIQMESLKDKGEQISSKYSLFYEKDIHNLASISNNQDLNDYLKEDNKSTLSQILSSKIIIDKLFNLLVICDKSGEVISSSRVTPNGELIPYINILKVDLSKENWFKRFISSNSKYSVTHLSNSDPIVRSTFADRNIKVSMTKLENSEYVLLGYTDENEFNITIVNDIKETENIIILSSENVNKRLFKNQKSITIPNIENATKELKKNGYKSVDFFIPKIKIIQDTASYEHLISIFFKKKNYSVVFSFTFYVFIVFILLAVSFILHLVTKKALEKSKITPDDFFKNGKVDRDFSQQFGDRLLVEPENMEKVINLSIDLQEGLKNFSNDKPLINTGIALLRVLAGLNNVSLKKWAEHIIDKQASTLSKHNLNINKAVVINSDYEMDGNRLDQLEKVINLLSDTIYNGHNNEFFIFPDKNKPIDIELDFSESFNNFKLFYNLSGIKFNSNKLSNSKISLFINEDDPKYIFNKSLLKEEKNLDLEIFRDVVMHIHEMRGVLFIKNSVDGIIFQISLPILFSHLLEIEIEEKKYYSLIKCTRSWTSRYDTDYFNNRLKMISTTYDFKNILLDLNDLEEISEIALVRLFNLQNEIEAKGGKLVIYKSFGKMESQHFYNLLGVKNRLNILGDIKMAKSTFTEKIDIQSTELKIEKKDNYTKIILQGKLSTVAAAKEFITILKDTAKKDQRIVIDMSSSSFLNSSILGVLASESLRYTKAGGKIVMLNPNDYVLESLEVFALDQIIPIVNDVTKLDEAFEESSEN